MTIQLSAEEQQAMEKAVARGQFTSVDEAVHAAIQNFIDEHTEWIAYVRAGIQEGLEDIENGRVVDGKQAMRRLRSRVRVAA